MTVTDERLGEIAADTVAADVDMLVNDPIALSVLLGGEDGVEDLPDDEHTALCDRLATAIGRHAPDLGAVLAEIEANDTNYEARYGLVLRALAIAAAHGYPAGIALDPKEPAWPVVYLELPTGQVSWHMPAHSIPYDGHTTDEKYQRCRAFTALRQSQ